MKKPPLGLTKRVDEVIDNYDGDTTRLKISYILTIRITNEDGTFDMPEIRSDDPKERADAILAKNRLKELMDSAKEIEIFIPGDAMGRITHYNAVGGRIAAVVFCDGLDVTEDEILSSLDKGKKKKPCKKK